MEKFWESQARRGISIKLWSGYLFEVRPLWLKTLRSHKPKKHHQQIAEKSAFHGFGDIPHPACFFLIILDLLRCFTQQK
jgi:hypothetical protein